MGNGSPQQLGFVLIMSSPVVIEKTTGVPGTRIKTPVELIGQSPVDHVVDQLIMPDFVLTSRSEVTTPLTEDYRLTADISCISELLVPNTWHVVGKVASVEIILIVNIRSID